MTLNSLSTAGRPARFVFAEMGQEKITISRPQTFLHEASSRGGPLQDSRLRDLQQVTSANFAEE
jgi:hypothetical protein